MPSSDSVLLLALVLAGCGGGHAYRDAPAIDLPRGTALGVDAAPPPEQRGAVQRAEPPPRDAPPEVVQGSGPRGTSGDSHEDAVGYAEPMRAPPEGAWSGVAIGVAHPVLPPGTLVELTALDTGRTIVAMVVAREEGAIVALSPGAAQALGVGPHAAVRVRSVAASPQDRNALRAGQPAGQRLDAPPSLLAALRRKLPDARGVAPDRAPPVARRSPAPVPPPQDDIPGGYADQAAPSPVPRQRTAPVARPRTGFVVQVAALSTPASATALARRLGGHVERAGRLYRVVLGPYATPAEAQRARDGAARRGYGDARISHTD